MKKKVKFNILSYNRSKRRRKIMKAILKRETMTGEMAINDSCGLHILFALNSWISFGNISNMKFPNFFRANS